MKYENFSYYSLANFDHFTLQCCIASYIDSDTFFSLSGIVRSCLTQRNPSILEASSNPPPPKTHSPPHTPPPNHHPPPPPPHPPPRCGTGFSRYLLSQVLGLVKRGTRDSIFKRSCERIRREPYCNTSTNPNPSASNMNKLALQTSAGSTPIVNSSGVYAPDDLFTCPWPRARVASFCEYVKVDNG